MKLEFVLKMKAVGSQGGGGGGIDFFALGRDRVALLGDAAEDGGRFRGFVFFDIFGSGFRFFLEDFISGFRLLFGGVFITSSTSGSSKGSVESSSSLYSSLSLGLWMLFPSTKRENLRHVQALRYYDIYCILYTVSLLIR